MATTEDTGGSSTAQEALAAAGTASRRIRARRWWYVTAALVMAAVLAAFSIALASWPDRLAEVIVPGLLVIGAILAVLARCGRTVPAAAGSATNIAISVSAGLMVVTMLLNRLLLPEGFSIWLILTGVLPALPFVHLAWRVGRG